MAALVLLAGCGGGEQQPETQAPPYEVVREADDQVIVEVESTEGLADVFEAVIADIDEEGGWYVTINCSTGGTDTSDNRLANGRYAVGNLGAAQTGLDDGETAFETVPDRECPADD